MREPGIAPMQLRLCRVNGSSGSRQGRAPGMTAETMVDRRGLFRLQVNRRTR